jgi:flagellar protein FlaG
MSAESFTTAMFLITAVVAAAVLINAIFPIIYNMAGTFSSSSHASDVRLRTDFVIIATFASSSVNPNTAQVWMKNIGSEPVAMADIKHSDVFCGQQSNFGLLTYFSGSTPGNGQWTATLEDVDNNTNYWDPGETLQITANTAGTSYVLGTTGTLVYFQYVLPDGISRSTQFTVAS